ncbi:MAG: ROK family protein [Candidatus Marinimicrobia bacterium]|nr:ROK family protein [Candidatus Neomarinimicrobiota bacterium]MDD5582098.1 ROK family protein [Candidatus Neomarinimicrobiota bacterium]
MKTIGIDLGGTKVKGALINEDGSILSEHYELLGNRSGKDVIALITHTIERLMSHLPKDDTSFKGIGICVPGIASPYRKTVWAPNIPGWDDLPLVEHLKNIPSLKKISIYADSDRACCLRGEVMYGNAAGTGNAVFITVGTGIGAGIMVDEHVLNGVGSIAGATGWMALERPYKEKFKSVGCFEYYASGNGLSRSAEEYLEENPSYQGCFRNQSLPIKSEEIFDHYDEGDSLSRFVLHQAIELWGMAVANYVSLFNPEIIVFGGGVFGPAVRFLSDIFQEAKKWAQPIAINQITLKESALKGNAALYGAAALPLDKHIKENKS